ncbi:MAG: hypothetical protein ACJ8FS_17070 [Sphingomicrobium sp.]
MTSPAAFEDQAAPLSEVIAAVAERIHYAEGRRTNFTVVAGALLAGGVAILTFIPDKRLGNALAYPALGASIGCIALGLLLLIVFARQTNRYPWTAATNTWKWFYRDALPDQKEFDWTWRDVLRPNEEKKRLQAAFGKQLPLFEASVERLKDPKVSFSQDVQQLYVLHINDKFKNAHLSQLRTILSRGLIVVAAISLGCALLGWSSDHRRTALHVTQARYGPVELSTRWRFVSSMDDAGLVLATVTIKNRGLRSVPLPRWSFVDGNGTPVPAVASVPTSSATAVPARGDLRYSIFIRPAEAIHVENLDARIP